MEVRIIIIIIMIVLNIDTLYVNIEKFILSLLFLRRDNANNNFNCIASIKSANQ